MKKDIKQIKRFYESSKEKFSKVYDKAKNRPALKFMFGLAIFAAFSFGIVRPTLHILTYGEAVQTSAAAKKLPIYCVETEEKKVAISFDAAWGADDTDNLIEILKKENVPATFFLCGYWIDKYPDEVKKLYEAGHTIGNHSNTHPHSNSLSLEENKKEIMAVHNKIKDLLGVETNLYRPPFGEYNDTVISAAEACGYYPIQWDVDSLDWKNYGVEHEIKHVLNHKHLGNGSIILFHNDAKYTPDALPDIIAGLREKGCEIVSIEDLIHKDNYYMNHEGRQCKKSIEETTEQ